MRKMNTDLKNAVVFRREGNSGAGMPRRIAIGPLLLVAIATFCCLCPIVVAQTLELPTNRDANNSWTATTDVRTNHVNPTRITESHTQNGNRTVDKRSIQSLGRGGNFEDFQDIETESVQVDPETVRITTRMFNPDVNGTKRLVQVTEEEKHTGRNGNSSSLRITSDADVNGTLKPVRRDLVETKTIGGNEQETDRTVMFASINGGFAPATKSHEVRKENADGSSESKKTTLLPELSGRWQVIEVRQTTTRQERGERSTEERVSRLSAASGKLEEVSRVVTKESESTRGEKRNVVETYSSDVPGRTPDGSLHLVERTTSTQRTSSSGEGVAQRQVERVTAGDPDAGLRITLVTNNSVHAGPTGVQGTQTIQMRDLNGDLKIVSVDTTKADRIPTLQIQQKP